MTVDRDIQRLRRLLIQRGHPELAALLVGSRSLLNDTGHWGNYWNSTLSYFEIYSPLKMHDGLRLLSDSRKKEILNCVHILYPVKQGEPEVVALEFYPNLEDLDKIEDSALVLPEKLSNVNYDYIQDQIKKCREKIERGDDDGAVTNARTLIESTCFFILEEQGIPHEANGKLNQLYSKAAKTLGMDASLMDDENIKKIISGATSIVDGVGGLRNTYGDAHGMAPKKRYKISKRHAVLVVNLAKSVSEFLYSSWEERRKGPIED